MHRLSIVVQLLLGEIPDIKMFREPILKKTLAPYMQLTQGKLTYLLNGFAKFAFICYIETICLYRIAIIYASKMFSRIAAVRTGDLKLFNQAIEQYKDKFNAEKTYTLIIR